MVNYTYDPWGKPTVTGDEELAALNPCSYRGYDYDEETGYYYLQSRYYDPHTFRFLNGDSPLMILAYQEMIAYNIYGYCSNNPITGMDSSGYWTIKVSVDTAATVFDIILLSITIIAIKYLKFKTIRKLMKRNLILKDVWETAVRAISQVIAISMNYIMKTFFKYYKVASVKRIKMAASVIAYYIHAYIDRTPGRILAEYIDKHDHGKKNVIYFHG